jgi:hypothetical protein
VLQRIALPDGVIVGVPGDRWRMSAGCQGECRDGEARGDLQVRFDDVANCASIGRNLACYRIGSSVPWQGRRQGAEIEGVEIFNNSKEA